MFLRKKKLLFVSYLAIVLGAVLFVHHGSASAATITVGGGCSFENAVASANANSDTGGCTGSGGYGDDTISLPTGTFALTASPAASTGNLTVTGAGVGQTIIDGDNAYDGITCDGDAGALDLVVSDLTISYTDGAALSGSNCNMDVSNVEISQATGEAFMATLGRANETFTININDTYIHDNSVAVAIGIAINQATSNPSNITINSHISGVALADNSPISPQPFVVGILVNDHDGANNILDTVVNNSTISNGAGSFGILLVGGSNVLSSLNLQNNTIVSNDPSPIPYAGGVNVFAGSTGTVTATLENNLFADNVLNCLVDSDGGTVSLTSAGHNLADDTSCGLTATGDQQGVSGLTSTLGPLQDNGGPTPTMALLTGSPAIDAGATIGAITTDQRGFARPQGSAYDIGAFEFGASNNPDPDPDPDPDNGGGNNNGNNSGNSNGGDNSGNQAANNNSGGGLAVTGAIILSPIVLGGIAAGAIYTARRMSKQKTSYRASR